MMLNGMRDDHKALIHRIAGTINALSEHRLQQLGCRVDRRPADLYKRVDDLFNKLVACLNDGFHTIVDGEQVHIDHVWFANRIGASPVPADVYAMSDAVAIDGTAIPTPARLHSGNDEVVHDGDDPQSQPVDEEGRAPKGQVRPKARILGIGPDGRKIYTADPDARGGYRSPTSQQPGGLMVGYEAHFFVLTRKVTWTNGADKATLSEPVPAVILNHALVPAGSSRTAPVVDLLTNPYLNRHDTRDVVVDPGYSIPDPHTFFTPLHSAGIHVTWQPTSHHQGIQPFNDNAFVYNGHLISESLPERLRDLPMPPRGANDEVRARYQAPWNEAARYRYSPHGSTDDKGTTRFRDPIDAGRLRSRDVPTSMRRSRTTPLVSLPEPGTYEATLRATAEQLPRWSKYLPGTTAHHIAYTCRRQASESANSTLRGDLAHLDGSFIRVFELHRINTLLAFTIAGFNYRRLAAYFRANDLADPNGRDAIAAEASQVAAASDPTDTTDTPEPAATEGSDPPA